MIQLYNHQKDGTDITIAISKNLNFLIYIYRYYDLRHKKPKEFKQLNCDTEGLISTAFFHLRGITLWNQILFALSDASHPLEADENNWYEESYDFSALFSQLNTYQAVKKAFQRWWEQEGEAGLSSMEKQISSMLADFPFQNLDQDHFLFLPVYEQYADSLTWGNEQLAIISPDDIKDPKKIMDHLTFMSK